MSTVRAARRSDAMRPGVRLGLLGLAVGIGWLLLTLFTGGSSASADSGDDQDGLLGSVLGGVVQTTQTVVQTTSAPVQQTVQAVQPVVAAVQQVAPIAPAPAPVVNAVVQTVAQTVAAVPATTTAVVETASDLVETVQVGTVVAPVTALVDTVVGDTAGSLPIVGEVVDELLGTTTPGGLIDDVVGDVDTAVDGLLGDTATGVIGAPIATDAVAGLVPGSVSTLLPGPALAARETAGSAGHDQHGLDHGAIDGGCVAHRRTSASSRSGTACSAAFSARATS